MSRLLTTWLVLCLCGIVAISQTATIQGIVTESEKGTALLGVNIIEKGTTNGTVTNNEGYFELLVIDSSAVLVFSFIGYDAIEKNTNETANWNITMNPNSAALNTFVVTALGLKRESKDLGYAVQKLESKTISEVKSPNMVDALAGQVAGVSVSQGATGVGSTSKISIRGEASFTNNNPLFVVDGTPINNASIVNRTNDAASGLQEVDFGNGAMEVNADDIAEISVLKGPSAAALYGTRANNGVILITTKKGTNQVGLGVQFNSSTFIDQAFQLPEFQNKYGQGNSGQFEFVDGLGGGVNDNISYSWGPQLDQGLLIPQFNSPVILANGNEVRGGDVSVHGGIPIAATPFVSHPDNLKDFYKTGTTLINNVAISGGTEQASMRLSFTDLRSESIIPGVDLNRQTVALSGELKPTDKLKVSSNINYVNSQSSNRPASGYGSENVNYSLVAWGPRSLDISALEDYWQPGLENLQQYSFNYTFFDNPYFILNENRNAFERDRVFGNVTATYTFNNYWSIMARTGLDRSSELRQFHRAFSTNRFQNGAYAEHEVDYQENNSDILLSYAHENARPWNYTISIGGNRMEQSAGSSQVQALTLAQPGIYSLNNAASPLEAFQFRAKKRINSIYGLAKFSYKEFLFIDLSARNDYSSALATPISTQNVSFFYPSVSTALVLSNLLDLPKAISFFKVRASWAQVGNDTDPYQTSATFAAQTPYNGQPTFSATDVIPNSELLPEQSTSIEFGTDIRFFKDRLRFDLTYFNALSENQIIALPVPISSGYTAQVVNGGAVRNTGIEAIVGIAAIRKSDFLWNINLNYSSSKAIVESLPNGVDRLTLAYSRVYDNENQTVWYQVEEGSQLGDMYGTGYARNENGDFIIDDDGRYVVNNDLILLGNYNPDFIIGMSQNLNYKNWDARFLIEWKQGGVIVSRTQALAGVAGQLLETENRPDGGIVAEGVVNTGTTAAPVWVNNTTAVSAESYYRQYYDRNHEENNLHDASFAKLRSVSIGYSVPMTRERGFLQSGRDLRLSLIGRNLLAISSIPHFDPEQLAVQGSQFVSGVEDMSYATSRSFGFKVSYGF